MIEHRENTGGMALFLTEPLGSRDLFKPAFY
jgi:hypothetical protein